MAIQQAPRSTAPITRGCPASTKTHSSHHERAVTYFLTSCTTSSSCSTCSLPTFCGLCFTEEPHTRALEGGEVTGERGGGGRERGEGEGERRGYSGSSMNMLLGRCPYYLRNSCVLRPPFISMSWLQCPLLSPHGPPSMSCFPPPQLQCPLLPPQAPAPAPMPTAHCLNSFRMLLCRLLQRSSTELRLIWSTTGAE